ncbi:copper resistance protein B [Phenylobacterium aquaticum]|uniref:copper resistance protein B n=1 Tax=Phenylobacterium aquaticum TaxID=1763816 RepID=UPI001F5D18F3|nr:copper resistance protein B [Phenylobacterium aquaticum]MCI3130864.1 copper resistance protein B [Phenylobacterium aquaticum]
MRTPAPRSKLTHRSAWLGLAAATTIVAPPALAQTSAMPTPADPSPAPMQMDAGGGHDMASMPGMTANDGSGTDPAMDAMPGMSPAPAQSSAAAAGAMAPMQGGRAPASARDPYAYSGGYQRSTMPNAETADALQLGALIVDQFEAVTGNQGSGGAWDVQGWYGGPFDRAWLRTEGDVRKGQLETASVEALWSHAYHPFWATQLGLRHDLGKGPDRTWLAFGVQGTTPYWYGMEATAYVGESGRTAARLKASSDLRFTQKLVLRPEIEANLYGRSDPARGLGSGLSTLQTALRLRYEIRREFAPYVGVAWNRAFGETERLRRAASGKNDEVQFVLGVRVWR